MEDFGVSLSVKQCRNFGVDCIKCLEWLAIDCGFKRFRLMSYWDEIEPRPGKFNFRELDKQIKFIASQRGEISLCLGAKQPRWPEYHWPDWAWQLSKPERTEALLKFVENVVERYKSNNNIVSCQLENEALLNNFGRRIEIDKPRLRREYDLVKQLAPDMPVVMTTSTSWGIPWRQPIPDIVGFSYYQLLYRDGRYTTAFHKPWVDKIRAGLIRIIWRRPSFIHELQLEPWGPTSIWELSKPEQAKSMSLAQIELNLKLAKQTKLTPIDLWGGEWWYWRHLQGDDSVIEAVMSNIAVAK